MTQIIDFYSGTMAYLAGRLLRTEPFNTGEWQSKNVSNSKHHATYELEDVTLDLPVPDHMAQWLNLLGTDVNYAWAEEHFQERVGGTPLNPPPSHERWPWARHNGDHQSGPTHQFSHTYPERMWPRHAGEEQCPSPDECRNVACNGYHSGNQGIRFGYGDLQDVVDLLVRSPHTRQAYLPIWFPEDTGAHHRQRVPCTLGYHFMIRRNQLSCRYYIRSCDLIRHFADDVYMAGRLMQWVCGQVNAARYGDNRAVDGSPEDPTDFMAVKPGKLIMHIASLHAFVGDNHKLTEMSRRWVRRGSPPQ